MTASADIIIIVHDHRLLLKDCFLVQMETPQWMGINHGVDQH